MRWLEMVWWWWDRPIRWRHRVGGWCGQLNIVFHWWRTGRVYCHAGESKYISSQLIHFDYQQISGIFIVTFIWEAYYGLNLYILTISNAEISFPSLRNYSVDHLTCIFKHYISIIKWNTCGNAATVPICIGQFNCFAFTTIMPQPYYCLNQSIDMKEQRLAELYKCTYNGNRVFWESIA